MSITWSGSITLHDPARTAPVEGRVRGQFEGHCPAEAQERLERELRLAVMDALHFGPVDAHTLAGDLPALSADVTQRTKDALAGFGATGRAIVEALDLNTESPVADWGRDGSPKWAGRFTVQDRQTGLTLAGEATGRFAGAPPADPTTLATIVVNALERVLAGAPSVVNAFGDMAALNEAVTDAALPQLEPLNSFGFVVVETGRYDEPSEQALLDWHARRKAGQISRVGEAVRVTWSDGKQYPGVVVKEGGGQYLVRMDSGEEHWISPAYVHFGRDGASS